MNRIKCVYAAGGYDVVILDGQELLPGPSQALFNHSPDGFAWGYGGSGPAQLALALLLAVTGNDELSLRLYHDFKDEFVSAWPQGAHTAEVDIAAWVAAVVAERPELAAIAAPGDVARRVNEYVEPYPS